MNRGFLLLAALFGFLAVAPGAAAPVGGTAFLGGWPCLGVGGWQVKV